MGLPDLFGTKSRQELAETRSALEQASAADGPGALGRAATTMIENLLDSGIDGKGPFDSAAKVVAEARRATSSDDEAVERVITSHTRLAAAEGFVTSLGGFITMPISLPANVLGFYLIATRMTAAVAALRGYDLSQQQIRSAVLLTLVGADSDDLLRKAGVVPASRLSNLAVQRLPGPVLMVVNKAVGFRLLTGAAKKTFSRLGKSLPVVGGVVGGGLDHMLMRSVAKQARGEFPPQS